MKWWAWALIIFGGVALAGGGAVLWTVHRLDTEQLSDDLLVLYGAGGNVAVLRTDEGAVVVDTMTVPYQGQRIRELARKFTGQPVRMVINTHYHLDHTHGNPAFDVDTRVVSTARTLHHLEALDGEFFSGERAATLPNETFEEESRLVLGGKTLRLLWPGRGHTDGDLVVVFEDEGVIHMGDLYFNGHYPNIDLEAGGSVQTWPGTLDAASGLAFDRVIPGHGPVSGREGLERFRTFMAQLGQIAREAIDAGTPREAFLETDALTADAGFEEIRMLIPLGLDRKFVLGRAYDELTGGGASE